MRTFLRKVGNSRGVLIPAALLAECGLNDQIELTVDNGRLIISPVQAPRQGWFDGYRPEDEADAWEGREGLAGGEDWEW